VDPAESEETSTSHLAPNLSDQSSSLGTYSRSYESTALSSGAARAFTRSALETLGAPSPIVRDFALAISELTANFIEYGNGSAILVVVDFTDPHWWEVQTIGFADNIGHDVTHPDTWSIATSMAPGGRGLGIVRRMMDDIIVLSFGPWVSV
jgi:anti-sigma regulatory factor (Ser/Thr protein kinase)